MNININHSQGFKWSKSITGFAKGYIFDNDDSYYSGDKINTYFSKTDTQQKFLELLREANGMFSVIIDQSKFIFAAVDRVRSMPLFYIIKNDNLFISDSVDWLKENCKANKIDYISSREFELTGYVTGNETLFSEIKQLNAGEYLFYDKEMKSLKKGRYFDFSHIENEKFDSNLYVERLDQVHFNVFKRLINSLENRHVVLPLSGGYDSRLIAQMLHRMNYKNVTCFTYGKPGNLEANISKEVASFYGFDWVFVPYEKETWNSLYQSSSIEKYFTYAGNYSTLPVLQDFPALMELKRKKIIKSDSIIIPGHAGDFIAGSHVPKDFISSNKIRKSEIIQVIKKNHYSLWENNNNKKINKFLNEKIEAIIGENDYYNNIKAIETYEKWDWQERQSKFISNSVRAYEYIGNEWRLPLWDSELVSFWLNVPMKNRYKRTFYFEWVDKKQKINISNNQESNENPYRNLMKNNTYLYSVLKKPYSILKRIKEYDNHPLQWYGILDRSEYYTSVLKGATNINSLLARKYLNDITSEEQ